MMAPKLRTSVDTALNRGGARAHKGAERCRDRAWFWRLRGHATLAYPANPSKGSMQRHKMGLRCQTEFNITFQ
jgi:hypothetical protein